MKKYKPLILSIIIIVVLISVLICANGLYQNRKLFNAIQQDDLAAAQEAIARGAWINTRKKLNTAVVEEITVNNLTPLETACKIGNTEMVELLLESGADINQKNKHTHSTALLNALHGTKSNRFSLAMYLIEQGADIHDVNQAVFLGPRIIYISDNDSNETIQEGYELFKYLMKQNVPIGFRFNTDHLLTYAARYGNYNVVKYLIEEGIFSVNQYDNVQTTALIVAAEYDQSEIVTLLLELGADVAIVNADGKTALDIATEKGNTTIAMLLSEAGVGLRESE